MRIFITMLSAILSNIIASVIFLNAAQAGSTAEISFFTSILNRDITYHVYIPTGWQAKRSYPVVYLLHGGSGGSPSDWFRLADTTRILDGLIANGSIPPVVAIAPDGRAGHSSDAYTYYLNSMTGDYDWQRFFIEEFIPFVEPRFSNGGSASRYVVGLSMGGFGAMTLLFQHPALFTGGAALSIGEFTPDQITSMPQADFNRRFGNSAGADLIGNSRMQWHRLNSVVSRIAALEQSAMVPTHRVFLACGTEDWLLDGTLEVHAALLRKGIKHGLHLSAGSHDWPYWKAILPMSLRFLMDTELTTGEVTNLTTTVAHTP
ncbi:esterase family protein [Aureimonas altamirensis]|uniref:alpha/beta hydrolase n=1 Tax=Aureimonas altamirensis TaxID=370622 RepID=UPI002036F7CE|nr:alpha/beta hydrolase-fold protein [Aureimonas altamirensis]MCM2503065.1 esterase family protein [Aureimonas altamirensis]